MKDSIIKTVPAAEALRKVPQFNPLWYLRQTTSRKTGEPVLKLDLRFKKMWFRLACADGRMVLTPMRITDSIAIFEAQVYLHGDDPKPIANFVSTMYAADVPGGRYIQAAQDTWTAALLDWLPQSEFEFDEARQEFEYHDKRDHGLYFGGKLQIDICIPIRQREEELRKAQLRSCC